MCWTWFLISLWAISASYLTSEFRKKGANKAESCSLHIFLDNLQQCCSFSVVFSYFSFSCTQVPGQKLYVWEEFCLKTCQEMRGLLLLNDSSVQNLFWSCWSILCDAEIIASVVKYFHWEQLTENTAQKLICQLCCLVNHNMLYILTFFLFEISLWRFKKTHHFSQFVFWNTQVAFHRRV